MPQIVDALREIKSSKDEVEEEAIGTVEEALNDSELVSVDRLGNANMEESIKIKLDYSGIEETLEESEALDGVDVSLSGKTLQLTPVGNGRY